MTSCQSFRERNTRQGGLGFSQAKLTLWSEFKSKHHSVHPRPHPPDKDGGYDGTDMIFSIIFSGRELPEVHTRGIFHVQSPLTSLSYCLIGQLHDLGED